MSRFLRTFEANSSKRHGKMDKQIELSQTEIELAFASFCIEGTARKLGLPYQEVFARMKRVGMIENHILPNYNILHTESREHVIDNIDVTYFRLFNIPDSLSELYNLRSTDLYLRPKSKW
ncbi:DUF3791 domain-containing protein [Parabacteroides distasonis]|uniref:DUF3791 domain-containing protein n=2 Tax=Parabacteroides distasonis TaxID=823 RepID=UPI0039B4E3C4